MCALPIYQIWKAVRRRHREDHDRRGEGRPLLYSDAPERENRGGNQDERYSAGSAADQYIAELTSPFFRIVHRRVDRSRLTRMTSSECDAAHPANAPTTTTYLFTLNFV